MIIKAKIKKTRIVRAGRGFDDVIPVLWHLSRFGNSLCTKGGRQCGGCPSIAREEVNGIFRVRCKIQTYTERRVPLFHSRAGYHRTLRWTENQPRQY